MERRHIKWLPLLLAGLFFAYQYFSSEKFVNPETGRKSHVAMSTREEASLGVQSYQQVLAQSESINSGPELEMVKRVASRLATATGKAGADFDWQVSLIRSSQVNAFCLPGGKIVVYTGILPVTQNESALATVLGHEMAHATSRHGSQRVLGTKSRPNCIDRCGHVALGHGLRQTTRGDGSAGRGYSIWRAHAI